MDDSKTVNSYDLKRLKIRSKDVDELTNVVLSVNKDSLLDIFFEEGNVNYDVLSKKILLPYFKLKSRVVKKNNFINMGEIEFKIMGAQPSSSGVVSSKTNIQFSTLIFK